MTQPRHVAIAALARGCEIVSLISKRTDARQARRFSRRLLRAVEIIVGRINDMIPTLRALPLAVAVHPAAGDYAARHRDAFAGGSQTARHKIAQVAQIRGKNRLRDRSDRMLHRTDMRR